jgi:hypothetical protein
MNDGINKRRNTEGKRVEINRRSKRQKDTGFRFLFVTSQRAKHWQSLGPALLSGRKWVKTATLDLAAFKTKYLKSYIKSLGCHNLATYTQVVQI